MKDSKKTVLLFLLVFLLVVLAIVIAVLGVSIRNKNEQKKILTDKVEALTLQKEELTNEIEKLNVEKHEVEKESAKQVGNTQNGNLNEEKEALVKKLLLEKMPAFNFVDSAKNKYKVVNKYIDKIEIYSEPYAEKLTNYDANWYADRMKANVNLNKVIIAIGTVSFTTEFDKTIEHDDVEYAGGSTSQMPYKNYVVQSFIFELSKTDDGEYKLELGTGW